MAPLTGWKPVPLYPKQLPARPVSGVKRQTIAHDKPQITNFLPLLYCNGIAQTMHPRQAFASGENGKRKTHL
jgi:hypothetical protein